MNVHHLFYYRRWYTRGWIREIRNLSYCKVCLREHLHETLHAVVPPIPPPTGKTAKLIYFAILDGLRTGEIREDNKPSTRIAFIMSFLRRQDDETFEALSLQYDFFLRRGL